MTISIDVGKTLSYLLAFALILAGASLYFGGDSE